MCWPQGLSTTGGTLTPSTGLGPTTGCASGSRNTPGEFVAGLRSRATRAHRDALLTSPASGEVGRSASLLLPLQDLENNRRARRAGELGRLDAGSVVAD